MTGLASGPLAKCQRCERPVVAGVTFCEECQAIVNESRREPESVGPAWTGSASMCVLLGLGFLLAGAMLLLDPTTGAVDGPEVVNLQRLCIGSTCGIAGAIFLAAGIRPR